MNNTLWRVCVGLSTMMIIVLALVAVYWLIQFLSWLGPSVLAAGVCCAILLVSYVVGYALEGTWDEFIDMVIDNDPDLQ